MYQNSCRPPLQTVSPVSAAPPAAPRPSQTHDGCSSITRQKIAQPARSRREIWIGQEGLTARRVCQSCLASCVFGTDCAARSHMKASLTARPVKVSRMVVHVTVSDTGQGKRLVPCTDELEEVSWGFFPVLAVLLTHGTGGRRQ